MRDEIASQDPNPILDAIDAAEEIPDPLDGLLEKSAEDPGAAFTPEVLERLVALKSEDPAAFETMRAGLRKTGCRVRELDKAMAAMPGKVRRQPTMITLNEAQSDDHFTQSEYLKVEIGSDVEIAKRVRKDLTKRHGTIVHAQGEFWRYGSTHWEAIPDHELRLPVHVYDGARYVTPAREDSNVKLTETRINSVLNECAALCAEPGYFDAPPAGINCASGLIRFDEEGTPRLEPHHREHRCRHTLPGRWQLGASGNPPAGSLLATLLNGSFKGDPEAEAKCALLAEVCGSAALGYATRLMQPRAVVLHGKTAENGKSQVLELARGLLPAGAISSVPASKMGDERHVVGLVGKLLNASDELSPEAIASDTFKAVVTGDPIQGRDVYRSRVEFCSVAQNLFAANELPSFKGGVDRGVQRRLLVIPFTRSIPLEERIENIGKRIAAEEPDLLLAWAVEGAARLIRQRNFAIPQGCVEALNEWVLGEDLIAAWVDACVQVVPVVNGQPRIRTRDAYQRFQGWALAEGFKTEKIAAINGFVQRVQAQVAGIQHKRTSAGRFFLGITVTQG